MMFESLDQMMRQMQREFWEENTASLLAYGKGRMFPSAVDKAEAKRRVAEISDEDLRRASESVAESHAKRCPECGRKYD